MFVVPLTQDDTATYREAWEWLRSQPELYGNAAGFADFEIFKRLGTRSDIGDFAIFYDGQMQALATFELKDADNALFHLIANPTVNHRALFVGLGQLDHDFFLSTGRTQFSAILPDEPPFAPVREFAKAWGLEPQNDNVTFIRYVQRQ